MRRSPFTTVRQAVAGALYTTASGRTIGSALDGIAQQHGSAAGVWHVVTPDDQLIFWDEGQARCAVAAYLRSARNIERLICGTARSVGRLHPVPRLRASGRSYRKRAAGMTWSVPGGCGYIRLYQRTEEMERGRRAGG